LGHRQIRRRVSVLVVAVISLTVLVNARMVYAQVVMATPLTVTQGQSFQVSGYSFDPSCCGHAWVVQIYVYAASTVSGGGSCHGSYLYGTAPTDPSGSFGPVTFSSSSFPPGIHCIYAQDYATPARGFYATATAIVIVTPAPAQYIPVFVGGNMFPINTLQVILPWIALITLLGTVSVWTLVVKRRDETN